VVEHAATIGYSVRSSGEPRGMLDRNQMKSIFKSSAAFDIPTAIDASLAVCDTFALLEARISLVGFAPVMSPP
jgi:hypothetical protein